MMQRNLTVLRTKQFPEPQLSDLIAFVDEECVLANDPLFSREALSENQCTNSAEREAIKRKQIKIYASKVQSSNKHLVCAVCSKKHALDFFPTFKSKDLKERSKLILKNRLCFGYYGADHIAKNCTKRRICKVYAGKYHSALHGYLPKAEITGKEKFAKDPTQGILLQIHQRRLLRICM